MVCKWLHFLEWVTQKSIICSRNEQQKSSRLTNAETFKILHSQKCCAIRQTTLFALDGEHSMFPWPEHSFDLVELAEHEFEWRGSDSPRGSGFVSFKYSNNISQILRLNPRKTVPFSATTTTGSTQSCLVPSLIVGKHSEKRIKTERFPWQK